MFELLVSLRLQEVEGKVRLTMPSNAEQLLEGETHNSDLVGVVTHDLSEAADGKEYVLVRIQGKLLGHCALGHRHIALPCQLGSLLRFAQKVWPVCRIASISD